MEIKLITFLISLRALTSFGSGETQLKLSQFRCIICSVELILRAAIGNVRAFA